MQGKVNEIETITNMLVPVIITRLVIPEGGDYVILDSIAGHMRSPCQFLPTG